MNLNQIFAAADISASGLQAERMHMEVVANNIANQQTTRTASGEPYRRQQVLFTSAGQDGGGVDTLSGVRIEAIRPDQTPFRSVYDPGHPHANADGQVELPNVDLPHEMVDLLVASRAYESNLKSLETFKQITKQTLSLLRDA
jgi:flagellar basal-body rod protein FlgC